MSQSIVSDRPVEGLASIQAAARFLSLSRNKLYAAIREGEVPARRFGKSVRVPWAWLHAQAAIPDSAEESR